ncbi:acetyl-CoA/propionyl-CoA carboxylase biotin carboxyl carrier protein [Conyzicola nivalis]|uniref:biotin carboxylase n=1 Tax=Conyzicola nivalis TaxID=1477021 RepID=A0ABV2QL95_9MICO
MSAVIRSVLVANRGEIACRIIRTLRAMGIRSIAVYSDADRGHPHVALADAAMRIGPAPARDSYLSVDAVVAAAVASGADAIHPGYGFLSENVELARAADAAGLVFIGPSVVALTVMGDKIRAKRHVAAHGVPVIPGLDEPGLDDAALIAAAEGIGYPLLVKPSAGGGGKGMHVVDAPADLAGALVSARRIAAAAFDDDTLFLERLIIRPRHIEVQVLADAHGAVIHLGERECSLQRRHQKVVEEAPSPLLDEATRARIGAAACEVARSVGYTGAGTVEFLVSASDPEAFFFMEMNTRLQVEHPVTELVTGIDLVRWQVLVAAGEPLTITQDDVVLTGHAVEARVYAEDTAAGFLPSTGRLLAYEPPTGPGVRVDGGVAAGLDVSPHYDPMLAKIVAHGADRAEAIERLSAALAATTVLGVATNLDFLHDLLADDGVRSGDIDTGLIERFLGEGGGDGHHSRRESRRPGATELAVAALWLHARRWVAASASPWSAPTGFRLGVHRATEYHLEVGGVVTTVAVDGMPDRVTVAIDGQTVEAALAAGDDRSAVVELDGLSRTWRVEHDSRGVWLAEGSFSCCVREVDRREIVRAGIAAATRAPGAASPETRVPMPGTVVDVGAASGDVVEVGQLLVTVEAMKMEHRLLAATAGTVTLTVSVGDVVSLDQVVATITPSPQATVDEGATP